MILLEHPEHGLMNVTTESEVTYNRAAGWKKVVDKPVAVPVSAPDIDIQPSKKEVFDFSFKKTKPKGK